MKIAVNVQTLIKDKLEGLGWFTYESLKRIVQQHPEHDFLFIFAKGVDESFLFADNVKGINVGPPFIRPQAWYIKFELLLPAILKKHKVDLFISTDGITSTKLKMKNLDVIHDLNFEDNPEWLPKSFAKYYKKNFPKWAKNATRIATVSEYSKQSIHQHYQIPLDQIDVVYNGSNELYQPISLEQQQQTKDKYTAGSNYFIFIGGLHPRKNIDKLLLGFDAFKQEDKSNMKLVIVGSKFYWNGPIKDAFDGMKFQKDVIFTGHLAIEELLVLLPSATALTYVSLFEGFGIPLVEAMNCDTAIITSNVTSLPEIAEDAALYVDPNNIKEIAIAMQQISSDSELRETLIEKGRVRRKAFSWQQTADKLWSAIKKTMDA